MALNRQPKQHNKNAYEWRYGMMRNENMQGIRKILVWPPNLATLTRLF